MPSPLRFRLFPIMALVLALPWAAPLAAADTYTIDTVHSGARFEISHLMFSTVSGQFTKFQGTVQYDPASLAKSSVEVEIDAASISTGSDMRDKDLRSPRFFDVEKFPTITFKSTSVTDSGGGGLSVNGTLTIHGVAKPVTIAVSGFGAGPGSKPGSFQVGFRKGTLQIKRSEYGITTLMGPVGDQVDIILSLEANKAQ